MNPLQWALCRRLAFLARGVVLRKEEVGKLVRLSRVILRSIKTQCSAQVSPSAVLK